MERVLKRPAINNRSPPHFPEDVLIEIFLKLPVRSLFLFRSVCKHWLRLIQSHDFIHFHLNRPISYHNDYNPLLIIHDIQTKSHTRTKILNRSSGWKKVLTLISGPYREDVPLEALSPSMACNCLEVKLLGPCNGLFCITDRTNFVVFNPMTRLSRQVQSPLGVVVCRRNPYYISRFSFGFDCVSNDYKVVGFRDIHPMVSDDSSDARYKVEIFIFRLSTNSWTQVDTYIGTTSYIYVLFRYDFFFNKAFHWLGYSDGNCYMFVFDLNKEALKQFELPSYFSIHDHLEFYLSVLDEYMAIIAQSETDCLSHKKYEIEIWVMKEYGIYNSWTKLYNIDIGAVLNIERPLSFSKDWEFLLWNCRGNLVSFKLNTRVIKVLGYFKYPRFALRFRGSLVSPRKS